PSMRGISRSSVITSGPSESTCLSPSSPSAARPTTRTSGSDSSIATSVCRLYALSSMTTTRIGGGVGVIVAAAPGGGGADPASYDRSWLAVHHVRFQVHERERRREVEQRLRVTQQQIAAARELAVESLDQPPPRGDVEVDDPVAAED